MCIQKPVLLLAFICGLACSAWSAYINDFDQPLDFHCTKSTQTISRVQSLHDSGHEDRRFDLTCTDILPEVTGTVQCYWTDFVNDYDNILHFSCPTNHYINGMNSIHDNHKEDRKWKFYCCHTPAVHLSDCSFSGWTNDYDKVQDFTVPAGQAMKGVISIHDSRKEDRLYEYEYCGVYQTDGSAVIG